MQEHVLDVRGLEPPEPLEKALDGADALRPGERLRMIHHREPCLLYPLLAQRGYSHLAGARSVDHFEILIWRSGDSDAAPTDIDG